jgi:hypothetical protein
MTIKQTIDQMQVAWPAAAGAHRQLSGQLRIRARSKRCDFFMSNSYPLRALTFSQRVRDAIQRIPY